MDTMPKLQPQSLIFSIYFVLHATGFTNVAIKKSRIRETKNLSTDADSRTDTIF